MADSGVMNLVPSYSCCCTDCICLQRFQLPDMLIRIAILWILGSLTLCSGSSASTNGQILAVYSTEPFLNSNSKFLISSHGFSAVSTTPLGESSQSSHKIGSTYKSRTVVKDSSTHIVPVATSDAGGRGYISPSVSELSSNTVMRKLSNWTSTRVLSVGSSSFLSISHETQGTDTDISTGSIINSATIKPSSSYWTEPRLLSTTKSTFLASRLINSSSTIGNFSTGLSSPLSASSDYDMSSMKNASTQSILSSLSSEIFSSISHRLSTRHTSIWYDYSASCLTPTLQSTLLSQSSLTKGTHLSSFTENSQYSYVSTQSSFLHHTISEIGITSAYNPEKHVSFISFSSVATSVNVPPTITPAPQLCDQLLHELTEAMSNMTRCTMNFMKPLQVCEKCHKQYRRLRDFHHLLFSKQECGNELIADYNEQYQIIPKFYDFQEKMWNNFDCNKCAKEDDHIPFEWHPSPQFLKFKAYLSETMQCFSNYSTIKPPYPVLPVNKSMIVNISSGNMACSKCRKVYDDLQGYFSKLMSPSTHDTRWCADIIYAVNETRRIWGRDLGCDTVQRDLESIIALTCFFCFMPIVFYVGTKLHSDVKERKHGSRMGYESD